MQSSVQVFTYRICSSVAPLPKPPLLLISSPCMRYIKRCVFGPLRRSRLCFRDTKTPGSMRVLVAPTTQTAIFGGRGAGFPAWIPIVVAAAASSPTGALRFPFSGTYNREESREHVLRSKNLRCCCSRFALTSSMNVLCSPWGVNKSCSVCSAAVSDTERNPNPSSSLEDEFFGDAAPGLPLLVEEDAAVADAARSSRPPRSTPTTTTAAAIVRSTPIVSQGATQNMERARDALGVSPFLMGLVLSLGN